MSSYLYELPTTGAVSFADFCHDPTGSYTTQLANATQARANLRVALKESKRADGEKDHLRLVLDDYLPHLCAIIACVGAGELVLKSEPVFSWRTTLASTLLNNSPRLSVPTLHADLAFALLTYAFALSNLARATAAALGAYERSRALSEQERRAKDDKLNFAVTLLCRASGVFAYVSETVLPQWERGVSGKPGIARPPELNREVTTALSKMALMDAQTLAIRKLLTKATAESAFSPGPPLPKSHPSPALVAKLHLECAETYASARALAKTPGASHKPKHPFGLGKKDADDDGAGGGGVASELRRYLADEHALHAALAHKWLGVDAGEAPGGARAGEAVAFLAWAKRELDELGGRGVSVGGGSREDDMRKRRKERVAEEAASAGVFFKYYKNMNDSLNFQPVPAQGELQGRIPAGRAAVAPKPFAPPAPAFGPGSAAYAARQAEELALVDAAPDAAGPNAASGRSYAGEGSYF
ncbi:hypothetical protein PUNSTDRAFT_63546 [Punctularia strigosozonata HHB-11173 SS5]|uniref:uncharacterized protein n=1 Tax=Punctularia strigosozonata (strain HHB-11173) TaxID=741275 RepID=UPI00044164F3|nr:uncharacterized protein PUNSTDRAFT_63546 [Punctularia strigosozonata HHB-11173 SS5]EIN11903.1 hypothetical protein PUNSTDRAFT_63546 [Punctularia strigosozonata HHB-11173 SS5]